MAIAQPTSESDHQQAPKGYCAVDKHLNLLASKWVPHIVWLLSQQPCMRFGQLRKQLALVSNKALSSALKKLEQDAFIWRRELGDYPRVVEYGLSTKGVELAHIIAQVVEKSPHWETQGDSPDSHV